MTSRARWLLALVKRRRWLFGALFVFLCLAGTGVLAVAEDEADRELMAHLRGDEDGSTDAQRQAHIDRAIELAPDRARYYEVRSLFRADHHDFAGALTDLDRAIELEDRPYLRHLRGLTLCELGDPVRALPDFDRAIAGQPDNTQFYRGRALARIEAGRAADALADGSRMVLDAPHWGESWYVRGRALAALGRDTDALADFDEAIARRPELVYAYVARAELRERMGDAAGARTDREEAVRRTSSLYEGNIDPYRY